MSLLPRKKTIGFTLVALVGAAAIGGVCYVVSPEARAVAVGLIEAVGADGVLAGLTSDPDEGVRTAAGNALARRGAAAVPALVRRLDNPERNDKVAALGALGRIGPPARDAVPAMKRLVWDDPDRSVQKNAAVALVQVAGADPDTAADFFRLLEKGNDTGRLVAADVLGRFPDRVAEVVAALAKALRDPHPRVREQAAETLARLGPLSLAAAPALAAAVGDPDAEVRRDAIAALEGIAAGRTVAP